MTSRRWYMAGTPLLFVLAIGCDLSGSLAPPIQAAAAGLGSTLTAPSGAAAVAVSQERIDLSWQDNSTNETGFEVHRSTESGTFGLLVTAAAGVTSHSDMGLTGGTQYCYQVRALKTSGRKANYSSFSPVACATTPAPPPPPPPPGPPIAPSSTDAVPATSNTVWITWSDNSDTEDGFRIERSTDGGLTWTTVTSAGSGFADGPLPSEQPVCYRVFAFNGQGDSPPSNIDCTAPPAGPTDLVGRWIDERTYEFTWTDNSGVEDGYEVWVDTYPTCPGQSWYFVAFLAADATSYRPGDWDLYPCVPTAYYVVAIKDGGYSDWSNPSP